jgi:hypothetical protein
MLLDIAVLGSNRLSSDFDLCMEKFLSEFHNQLMYNLYSE